MILNPDRSGYRRGSTTDKGAPDGGIFCLSSNDTVALNRRSCQQGIAAHESMADSSTGIRAISAYESVLYLRCERRRPRQLPA